MSEQLKIRPDVPLDWHPDALGNLARELDVEGTLGRGAIRAAREGLANLYTAAAKVADTQKAMYAAIPKGSWRPGQPVPDGWRIAPDGTLRLASGREAEFAKAVRQRFDATAGAFEHRLREVNTAHILLADRVHKAVFHPEDKQADAIAVSSEIRAHFKAMPSRQRVPAVLAAIQSGDRQAAVAVLGAPPYLSGLDAGQIPALRTAAEYRFAPVDRAQCEAVGALSERLTAAASSFAKRFRTILAETDQTGATADASIKELAHG